jgi:hypothetical protein
MDAVNGAAVASVLDSLFPMQQLHRYNPAPE